MSDDSIDGSVALYLAAAGGTTATDVSITELRTAVEEAEWDLADGDASGGSDQQSVDIDVPDEDRLETAVTALTRAGYVEGTDGDTYALTDDGRSFVASFRSDLANGIVSVDTAAIPILEAVAATYGSDPEDSEEFVELLRGLGSAYTAIGAPSTARARLERGLDAAEHGDEEQRSTLHMELGRAYEASQQFEDARDQYGQAKYLATEAGLDSQLGDALMNLGSSYYETTTDLEQARSTLESALDSYQSAGDTDGECAVRRLLTTVTYDAGEFDAAVDHGQRALDLAEEMDDEETATFERSLTLAALGRVHTETGDLDTAIDRLEAAIDAAADGTAHEVRAQLWLVDAHIEAGDPDEAEAVLDEAEQTLEAGTVPEPLGALLTARRALIAIERGEFETAHEHSDAVQETATNLGFGRGILLSHYLRGQIELAEDKDLWAKEHLLRAKRGGEDIGEWDIIRKAESDVAKLDI